MTPEQLIQEGRALQRDCVLLKAEARGDVAALWHEEDESEIEETGWRCWITIDTRFIPAMRAERRRALSVFTDHVHLRGGRVEFSETRVKRKGVALYAHRAQVLPPIDAVFLRGSENVARWLESHGWERNIPCNSNFPGADVADAYERAWQSEHPIYGNASAYAMLGGWHMPWPDDDWYDLIDDELLVTTIEGGEPWVEAWRKKSGAFEVFQRTT